MFCGMTGTFKVKKLLKNTLKVCDFAEIWPLRHTPTHPLPSCACLWKEKMIICCHAAADVGWHVSLSSSLYFLLSCYLTAFLCLCLTLIHRPFFRFLQPDPRRRSAAGYNNLEVAEYLLEHGADVNAQDKGGLIPLHNAASYGVRRTEPLLLLSVISVHIIHISG